MASAQALVVTDANKPWFKLVPCDMKMLNNARANNQIIIPFEIMSNKTGLSALMGSKEKWIEEKVIKKGVRLTGDYCGWTKGFKL